MFVYRIYESLDLDSEPCVSLTSLRQKDARKSADQVSRVGLILYKELLIITGPKFPQIKHCSPLVLQGIFIHQNTL